MRKALPALGDQEKEIIATDRDELTSPEALRAIAQKVRGSFPRPLLRSELVLIDVDPQQLHAFWNLPVAALEQSRKALPDSEADAPLVLRVSGADGLESFDIEVQGLQNQAYVDVWAEQRCYRGVLGLRRRDGSIVPLLTSEPVTLPNIMRSAEPDEPTAPPERVATAADAPADAVPVHTAPASEQPPPLELETVLALSSFAMGSEVVQLEVNAELRIFGRTKPGSELRLFGRRVALKPDGSFSISRPLPNGALVMTALLTGGDGD